MLSIHIGISAHTGNPFPALNIIIAPATFIEPTKITVAMTNTFLRKTLGFCLAALFAFACNKELNDLNGSGPEPNSTTSFYGRITDERGAGIPDVSVQIGNKTALTDANGVYRIAQAQVNSRRSQIIFKKTGFWTLHKTSMSRSRTLNRVDAMLLPQGQYRVFHSTNGGKITLDQGEAFVEFQPNSIAQDGQSYNGTVIFRAIALDISKVKRLMLSMPGDLRGIRSDSSETMLQTYGMLGVEITTPDGMPLQIAEGQSANIGIRKPGSSQGNSLPMWHFDTAEGIWREEGLSQTQGEYLTATVGHFSWWNWDAAVDPVFVAGKITHHNGQPFKYASVSIRFQDDPPQVDRFITLPDSAGHFLCMAPKEMPFYMSFFTPDSMGLCNNLTYSFQTGPFETYTDLGTIEMNYSADDFSTWRLKGQFLTCDGKPVSKGYAIVEPNGRIFPLDQNGHLDQILYRCNSVYPDCENYVYVMDQSGEKSSDFFIIDSCVGTVDLGTQEACLPNGNFITLQLENEPPVTFSLPDVPESQTGPSYLEIYANSDDQYIRIILDYTDQYYFFPVKEIVYQNGSEVYMSKNGALVKLLSEPNSNPGNTYIGVLLGQLTDAPNKPHIKGAFRIKAE